MKVLLIGFTLLFWIFKSNAQTYTRDDAGLIGNNGAVSGFFETINPTNYPAGAVSWWHLLDIRHNNPFTSYAMQMAGSVYDQNFWVRKTAGNGSTPWSKMVTEFEGLTNVNKLTATNINIFGNSSNATNLILSANYPNAHRWKFKTIDRGYAIDLDIVASGGDDGEEELLKLSPTYSGRPEFALLTDWFVINNGNVGIGIITPNEKLAVNGKIRAKEIKVEPNPATWPDYVFSRDYKPTSLPELEKYITENKHLPEMPTAKDVAANGVELGEMNRLLLKKMEEMTLLVIELNKKVTAQTQQINQQQAELKELKNKVQ